MLGYVVGVGVVSQRHGLCYTRICVTFVLGKVGRLAG